MIRADLIGLAALALIGMSACGGKSAQSGSPSGKDSQAQNGSDSSPDAPSGGDTQAQTGSNSSPDAPSGGEIATLPACRWPATLDPADGSTGQCVAARTVLSCQGSKGGGERCLSNDATQCPGPDPIVGETFSACRDQCNSDEYAVACGGPGPGPWPPPPSGCRGLPSGPGGGSLSCCPCGPTESLDSASDALVATDDDGGIFGCGSSSCDGRAHVCEHVQGGVPPGVDFYACIPIPAACDHDVSCTCVTTALSGRGANQCSAAGADVTVQIDVP